MTILFRLPKDISVDMLSQWCHVTDLVRLDTACSSVKERPDLLKIFSSTGFDLTCTVNLPLLKFCVVKGMTLKSIDIAQEHFHAEFYDINLLEKVKVSKVEMFALKTNFVDIDDTESLVFGHRLANKCGTINCIRIRNVSNGDLFISALYPHILHNLKELYFYVVDFGPTGLRHLAQHCHLLEEINIADNEQMTPEADMIALIISNPNLTHIRFNKLDAHSAITNQTVRCVIDRCPKILLLILSLDAPISLSTINALLSQQPLMEHIHICFKDSDIEYKCGNINDKTGKKVTIYGSRQQQYSEHELVKFFALTGGCESVNLFGVHTLNSVVINAVSVHNSASLSWFCMARCSQITSTDVVNLIEKCPLLIKLTANNCPLVEKAVIEKCLDKQNRRVEQLYIE